MTLEFMVEFERVCTVTHSNDRTFSLHSCKQRQYHGDLCRSRNLFKHLETLYHSMICLLDILKNEVRFFKRNAIQICMYFCNKISSQ